jgi:hypothetical protein
LVVELLRNMINSTQLFIRFKVSEPIVTHLLFSVSLL